MSHDDSKSRLVEFEIELDRRIPSGETFNQETEYSVGIRYRLAESEAEVHPKPGIVHFDWNALSASNALLDPTQYGQFLSDQLFADRVVRESFITARAFADAANTQVRLRLGIAYAAPELNDLYWETLIDPLDEQYHLPLSASQRVIFSRYPHSADSQPVRPYTRGKVRALVVICNPTNLDEYGLPAVPLEELKRMNEALSGVSVSALPDPVTGQRATLENLIDSLRNQKYDILYIVCHGMLKDGQSWLFMEDEAGRVQRVRGDELAAQVRDLPQRPLLAVLVSCQSAAFGEIARVEATEKPTPEAGEALSDPLRTYTALRALGPRLAVAGIPAVLAMHGDLSMPTAATLVREFFKELLLDGQVDRALAAARFKIRERPDAWLPVLFMRLEDGRIWYKTGFYNETGEPYDFDWQFLVDDINDGECTPILGPGLYEWLLGTEREIARAWARLYDYPLAPYEVESLPRVAEYMRLKNGEHYLHTRLVQDLGREIIRRHGRDLKPEGQFEKLSLDELISQVHERQHVREPNDPYTMLAQMPFKVYPTANPAKLLDAILAAQTIDGQHKQPHNLVCPWKEALFKKISLPSSEGGYTPSPEQPLVYHLLGRLEPVESMVLTEDDYFNYLIGVTQNQSLIPPALQEALTRRTLLFIGFQIEDWNFRVLLSYILSFAGAADQSERRHIAVQLRPERERLLNPPKAYKYLEELIAPKQGLKSSIYWGSAGDFVHELYQKWREAPK